MTEDEMVGWHCWLNGHEFEQTLGDGEDGDALSALSSPGGVGLEQILLPFSVENSFHTLSHMRGVLK